MPWEHSHVRLAVTADRVLNSLGRRRGSRICFFWRSKVLWWHNLNWLGRFLTLLLHSAGGIGRIILPRALYEEKIMIEMELAKVNQAVPRRTCHVGTVSPSLKLTPGVLQSIAGPKWPDAEPSAWAPHLTPLRCLNDLTRTFLKDIRLLIPLSTQPINPIDMASHLYDKGLSAFERLSAQFHHYGNTTIAVTTISIASIFALTPLAYRDYKLFLSYGPGGVPYNAFGWLITRLVLGPMTSETLSIDVYEGQEDKRSWLPEGLQRKGERPIVGPHAVPQRQLSQVAGKKIQQVRFFDYLRKPA